MIQCLGDDLKDLPRIGRNELAALINQASPSIDYLSLDRCYLGGNAYFYQLAVNILPASGTEIGLIVYTLDEPVLYPSITGYDWFICEAPDYSCISNGWQNWRDE